MRKKLIAGNWKMNKTPSAALDFVNEIKMAVDTDIEDVAFCVPFVCIPMVLDALKGTKISVGAQNMYYEDSGAYTGEISADMLLDLGVKYVICGHSERREYFAETDHIVNKKAKKAIEKGLIPIICVGETLTQREEGITIELVRLQTKIALQGLTFEQVTNIVMAYEPIWAIGTGKTATVEQAEEVCLAIRKVITELYDDKIANEIRILYGGSVNGGNAKELFDMPNIDGGLVGGASLKPEFANIVKR